MNKEVLVEAGFDVDDGIRRCGENADLYEKLLDLFMLDESLNAGQDALAIEDWEGLFSASHELKGVSGNISIKPLYESSSNVVALLRAQDYAAVPAAFETLAAAYEQAKTAIVQSKK